MAWMCCLSTWPSCSALSRKPGPALVPTPRVRAFLCLAHSSGRFQAT